MILPKKTSAFTLAEMIILMTVIGITLMISFSALNNRQLNARVNEAVEATMSFIQMARGKSFSNLEIDGETADGYYVYFNKDEDPASIELYAHFASVSDKLLESFNFFGALTLDITDEPDVYGIKYSAPDGEVEIIGVTPDLVDLDINKISIAIQSKDGDFPKNITFNAISGVPELAN